MEKKLEVKNLRISFRTDAGKVQAVRGIDFDLYKGETLAIVGESGSGKSVTNKAIIGISAVNAIVESGEILYDGMDLLQISEEEFHKLRGDKIAMIFQDPLSALDPINRVGGQITEAIILKNRANRKDGRKAFNTMIKNLLDNINNSCGNSDKATSNDNAKKCKDFNTFEVLHLKLEGAFAKAQTAATVGYEECHDLAFLIEKNAVSKLNESIHAITKAAKQSVHRYVLGESVVDLAKSVVTLLKSANQSKDWSEASNRLAELEKVFEEGKNKPMPNYFAYAYYQKFGNEKDSDYKTLEELNTFEVDPLNAFLREYLDKHFMLEFIDVAKSGIVYSHKHSLEAKKNAVKLIESSRNTFIEGKPDKKAYRLVAKQIISSISESIDKLQLVKDSLAYTFSNSLTRAIETYFGATVNNVREQRRFDKEMKKYNAILAKGKTPSYKVIPAKIIDLDLARENIVAIIDRISNKYKREIEVGDTFDGDVASVAMIDYLKEKAQIVAHKVTKAMAKEIALNLMEEVGIPEVKKRYRQYPFEFSGGMRQRIVIAIALAANPDVLICDEPTTALDVTIQGQILELINKIKKERNLSIIFITHDLGVVANMADRVAVMYAGKIVEMGTVQDIFYEPAHPYTWALLSSMPDLDTNEKLESIPGTPPNMIYPPKGDAFAARNKYALKIDYEEEPPMFTISETHKAATWLLHPNAPKVEVPKTIADRVGRMKLKMANDNLKQGEDDDE